MGVLGALAVTSEYTAGTITPSLTAVPDRYRLLAAKALTTVGISLGTGLAASTGAFLAGQALLARRGAPHDTFRSPGSARAVLGGGLHSTAAALLGLAIGVHTRSTAGAVSTIFGAEWLVPGIGPALPKPLPDLITKYWLTEAGASIFATRPDPKPLSPWAGLGVMAGSAAACWPPRSLRSGSETFNVSPAEPNHLRWIPTRAELLLPGWLRS